MDQQPTNGIESTRSMDLTGVMPQRIQPTRNALRRQTPPHLPSFPPVSQSRPLPTVPTLPTSVRIESQNPIFPLNNIENRHFSSHNMQNRPFLPMNQPFSSQNNQYRPLYDTQALPFPFPTLLPTIKEPSMPSSPTYIPILTGRSDWCPWSEALMTAVIGMNLLGHLAEHYDPQWGYDPGSIPTFPPVGITSASSQEELHTCALWWYRDGQVLHLLVSRLSPSARAQLPGAGNSQPQRRTARSVYTELVRLFGGTDYQTAAVTRDELISLRCAPSRIADYIARWRTGLNKLASAGHPFDSVDAVRYFVNHLPFGSTFDIIRESVLYSLSTARTPDQLPSFESIVERVTNIDLNRSFFQPTRQRYSNNELTPNTTHTTPNTSSKDTPAPTSTTNPAQPSRSNRSAIFCTGCRGTGHTIYQCPTHGGVQAGRTTDHTKPAPRVYLADVDADTTSDGGAEASDQRPPPVPDEVVEDLSMTFAALGTTSFVPSTSPVNNDILFDVYQPGVIATALSSLADLSPTCLSSITTLFNAILDSGCTHHIIRDRSLFWTYHTSQAIPVKTANCGTLETLAKGDVKVRLLCGTTSIILVFRDCLHAPSAPINLISVGAMQERRMRVHFNEDTTVIHFPSDHPSLAGLSFQATVFRRLSFLQCDFIIPTPPLSDGTEVAFPTFPAIEQTPVLWHRRFGHLGIDATRAVLTKDYATGVNWSGALDFSERCIPCIIGKHPQIPYSNHRHRASAVCELLHMDSCGPFPVHTPHKKSSFWAILDDKSNYGHIELLAAKSDVFNAYRKVESLWEAKSGNRVITVRMDGAKEFCQGKLEQHFNSRGITMQVTAPYAHSQNGKIEHYIRTLEDGFQTLLADSGLSMSYWGDAVLTMNYIRNRVPTSTLPANITPYEEMEHKKPDLSNLRVWGCQCFVAIPPELRAKGGSRRFEAIFVGYEENRIGWRVRDLQGKYHFSRDVIFNELVPGRSSSHHKSTPTTVPSITLPTTVPPSTSSLPSSSPPPPISSPPPSSTPRPHTPRPPRRVTHTTKGHAFADAIRLRDERLTARRNKDSHPQQTLSAVTDFISYFATDDLLSSESIDDLASHEDDSFSSFCLLTSVDRLRFQRPQNFDMRKAPESYHEALARPDADVWQVAMRRELDSLEERHAFERTTLPSDRKAIGLRWCYAYKFNPDGSIIKGKEKARLVAQGFSQRPEDYGSTYSPVAKITSIRIALAYAAHYDLEILSFDVKTAFLHAKLSTIIYCKQIPGFPEPDSSTVLRLLVALYGLRQSSYEFYTLLRKLMIRLGMTRCEVDHAVFYGRWSSPPDPSIQMPPDGDDLLLLVPVHVDDGLAITNSVPLYNWFIMELSKELEVVDLGPVSMFLAIRIHRDRTHRKIFLSQKSFVTDLLDTWNMSNCHPSPIPLRQKLHELSNPPPNSIPDIRDEDIKLNFQRLVGSLIYLAVCTRPDIAYVAMALGQYNASPTRAHLLAAKGVLRYLAGTQELTLVFGMERSNISTPVQGFSMCCGLTDADWATDEKDRRSISGYCFYFLNSLVSWSSTKQKTVSLSSTESEYYAMTHAMKEALWIRLFLTIHRLPIPKPFPLLCDNQSALALIESEAISSRSKHIDVRYHFIREHIAEGSFHTNWIPTSDMTADILTKPLLPPLFLKHRNSLGLIFL
jgi:hypothetical protein